MLNIGSIVRCYFNINLINQVVEGVKNLFIASDKQVRIDKYSDV